MANIAIIIALLFLCFIIGIGFLGLLAWNCYREHLWGKERSKLVNRVYAKDFKEFAASVPKTDPDTLHVNITQEPVPAKEKPENVALPTPEYLEEITGIQG